VVTRRSCDVRDHNNDSRNGDNSVHNCKMVISVVIMDVFVIK
jgi:hypothetical protein